MIEFVTASHKPDVLKKNLLKSAIFKKGYHLVVQQGYANVAQAYNDAAAELRKGTYVVYVHHDVILPSTFENDLLKSIDLVNRRNTNWGVLGVAGVKMEEGTRYWLGNLRDRGKNVNSKSAFPIEADTTDEVLLVTHGELIFDEAIPGNHFYGADICMQAKLQGLKNYVIDAHIHHNSSLGWGERTPEFYKCKEYFTQKYIDHLPIATTCTIATL